MFSGSAGLVLFAVSVIGAEEMFPFVFHYKRIAQLLKLPSLPITMNLFPLPSPIDIYIGKEIPIPEHLEIEAIDKDIRENVFHIEHSIKRMLITGLKNRRPFFDSVRKPIAKFVLKEFKNKRKNG